MRCLSSGYPECDDTRRLDIVDEEQPSAAVPHLRMLDSSDMSEEFLAACVSEQEAVLETLREGLEGVSDSCNALLKDDVDFQCFALPTDEDASTTGDVAVEGGSLSRSHAMTVLIVAVVSLTALLMCVRRGVTPSPSPKSATDQTLTQSELV